MTEAKRYLTRYYLTSRPRKNGGRWRSIMDGLEGLPIGGRMRVYFPHDQEVHRFQVNLINQIARKVSGKQFRTWRVTASILVERTG